MFIIWLDKDVRLEKSQRIDDMLDSKEIRAILAQKRAGTSTNAPRIRGVPRSGEKLSQLKKRINDQDYMDVALMKIAADLAREFY